MSRFAVCFTLGFLLFAGCAAKPEGEPSSSTPAAAPAAETAAPAVTDTPPAPEVTEQPPAAPVDTPAMKMPKVTAAEKPADTATPAPVPSNSAADPVAATDALSGYVGEEAVLAFSVHPAGIATNPIVKKLFEMGSRIPGSRAQQNLEQFQEQVGITPEQIKQVLVVVTNEELAALPAAMLGGAPPRIPLVAIEFTSPEAAAAVLDAIPPGTDLEIGGHSGRTTPDGSAVLQVEAARLLIGNQSRLEQAVAGSKPGGLTQRLVAANGRQVTLAVDVAALAPQLQQLGGQAGPNPALIMVMGIVQQLKALDLSLSLDGQSLLSGNIEAINADSAQGLQQMLTGLVDQGSNQMQSFLDQTSQSHPAGVPFLTMASDAVKSLKITAEDSKLSFSMARPEKLDQLPELLEPMYAEASKAAGGMQRKNSLKQIALAFHNHHDVFNHFPAPDANGGEGPDRKGAGLSWRVHLLPFLDQAPLYNEFKLDEPWDSEHNSQLIARIPEIYANSDEEGKTSLHVFIGEEAAFRLNKKGPSLRDITDGTSNTILVVEAGPDTADTWTKPGGLEINAKEPFLPLGQIGERLLVVLMDGSVREVSSTLSPEILHNMIRPADGNPIKQ